MSETRGNSKNPHTPTRSKLATSALGTLGVRPVKVSARFARVWAQFFLNMLKGFLNKSSACLGRVTYTSRISSTRATGAFGLYATV